MEKTPDAERPIESVGLDCDLSVPALFRDPIFGSIAREFIQDLEVRLGEIRAAVRSLSAGDEESIRRVRSLIHTLKGAGWATGYGAVSVACHALEEFLQRGVESQAVGEAGLRRIADAFVDLLEWIRQRAAAGETSFREAASEINLVIDQANASLSGVPVPEPPASSRGADPGPRRVLIVDAPGLYRRILGQLLEGTGARPIEVGGVAEALGHLEEFPVDAVIVARDLRGIGGESLVAAMKVAPALRAIPVVLVQSGTEAELPEGIRPDRILEETTATAVVAAVRDLLDA